MKQKCGLVMLLLVTFLLGTGFTGKDRIESILYTKEPTVVYKEASGLSEVLGTLDAFEEVAVIQNNMNQKAGFAVISYGGQKGYVKLGSLHVYETVIPYAVEAGYKKLMLQMLYVIPEEPSGIIFMGDSRTGQMFHCVREYGTNDTWIAQSGEGYDWFSRIAVPITQGAAKEGDKIVIQMGINDLFGHTPEQAAMNYMIFANSEMMEWVMNQAEVYVVSINPVEKHGTIKNEQIEMFNLLMQSCLPEEIHYIDTYSVMKAGRYPTVDGIHYSNEVYEKIYRYILNVLDPANAVFVDFNDYPDYLFPKAPDQTTQTVQANQTEQENQTSQTSQANQTTNKEQTFENQVANP